jgi:hypothetical protein
VQGDVARVEQASEPMAAVGTKSPGRLWLPGRGGRGLGVLNTRLVHSGGYVKVKTIGHDHIARGVTAGGGPALLPPTRLAPTSPDRLVAALVIMIQQASRNQHPDAGTLAASKSLRTA